MDLKILCCAFMLFILPVTAAGQASKAALTHTLYIRSGIDQHTGQLPESIQADFEHGLSTHKRLREMPHSTITKLRSTLRKAFAPDRFKKEILIAFQKELSIDDLTKVLAWLDSSAGKKIAQLEAAASRSGYYDGLQQYEALLQASPPPPKRLSIIRQLDSASNATDSRVDVALTAQLAVAMLLVEHFPSEKKPTTEALTAAIEKNSRALMTEAMRHETQLSFLYAYDSLATCELKRYTAFASSPAGKSYHDAIASGINTALTKGCNQWRRLIAGILNP